MPSVPKPGTLRKNTVGNNTAVGYKLKSPKRKVNRSSRSSYQSKKKIKMSSSSCVESSDEEEDNPYPITNPHYINDLKSTMPLVIISVAIKDHSEVDTNRIKPNFFINLMPVSTTDLEILSKLRISEFFVF